MAWPDSALLLLTCYSFFSWNCLKGALHQLSYGEKIYVYIWFLGSFGNLASVGSRMNGKWKLVGEGAAWLNGVFCELGRRGGLENPKNIMDVLYVEALALNHYAQSFPISGDGKSSFCSPAAALLSFPPACRSWFGGTKAQEGPNWWWIAATVTLSEWCSFDQVFSSREGETDLSAFCPRP